MANQLIPPPGMEPGFLDNATVDQCFALWASILDANEELVLAGLRRQIGPEGDLLQAYRCWYAQKMEEHDRWQRAAAQNLYRRGVKHGR
jgi:hypothetical protein